MKIRCITNSIRLRLRKSDLQQLETVGKVEEHLVITPASTFVFRLTTLENNSFQVVVGNNSMEIQIPKPAATNWIHSKAVSLQNDINNGTATPLQLLIEKDFPCKHTDADFEDTFYELANLELE